MPSKLILGPERRTHPLVWCAAIICTIIAIAVIITGLIVFIGYMIIHPRVPYISITYAHLDKLIYDTAGQLDTQITLNITAENDNAKAHSSFSEVNFFLYFSGLKIAQLRANPFDVPKNSSVVYTYVVPSSSIPLEKNAREEVHASLNQNKITFDLIGNARTRWKIGVLGSVKFWSHLSCHLHFFPYNGSITNSHCTSKSR